MVCKYFVILIKFIMKSIAVYCGSMKGNNPLYSQKATEMGKLLAERGIHLVYGGGRLGLMGVIGTAVIENGGTMTGVAPHFLSDKEVLHHQLTTKILVRTMAQRRTKMIALSDGFIAMPGGYGTLDEISEILMLNILGNKRQQHKPIGFLNVDGFYDPMMELLDRMTRDGFLQSAYRAGALFASEPEALLALMDAYEPQGYSKFESGDVYK